MSTGNTGEPVADKVFISHSSKDMQIAKRLYGDLRARDVACWMAPDDIEPGLDYQSSIVRAIRGAKAMLLVFTKNANDSKEVSKEVALANKYGLLIIPARIEDVVPNDALEYELTTRQWHDLAVGDWPSAMDGLAAHIKRAHREGEIPDVVMPDGEPKPESEPQPANAQIEKPTYRHTEPLRPPPEGFFKVPPVQAQATPAPLFVQLRWAGLAMIVGALAHIACLIVIVNDNGVWDDDTKPYFLAMFAVTAGELITGSGIYNARSWARWPGLSLCSLLIAVGLLFSFLFIRAIGEVRPIEWTIGLTAPASVAMFGYCAYVLYRWQPATPATAVSLEM